MVVVVVVVVVELVVEVMAAAVGVVVVVIVVPNDTCARGADWREARLVCAPRVHLRGWGSGST